MADRGPNARVTIIESMAVGQHVNERDLEKVRQRDAQLIAAQAQKEHGRGQKRLIASVFPDTRRVSSRETVFPPQATRFHSR